MKEIDAGLKLTRPQVFALKNALCCAKLVVFWLNKATEGWQRD